MTTTLRDFLANRETQIKDELKSLKAELRELQAAKAAVEEKDIPTSSASTPTIKEMARAVLSSQPAGLNSNGILDGIKKQFGREIERSSLSPQLSRLKDDGELILENDLWLTKEHWSNFNSASDSEPSTSSVKSIGQAEKSSQSTSWHVDDSYDFDDDIPF